MQKKLKRVFAILETFHMQKRYAVREGARKKMKK
jgi:hypothetical protein